MEIFPVDPDGPAEPGLYFGSLIVPDGGFVGRQDGIPRMVFDYGNEAIQLGGTNLLGVGRMTITGTADIGLDMSGGTFATAIQKWPAGTIQSTGDIVFQPTVNSTTAYQYLAFGGVTPVLNIDTDNEVVGVKTAAPLTSAAMEVNGKFYIANQPVGDATTTANIPIHVVENATENTLRRASILIENTQTTSEAILGFRTAGTSGMFWFGLNDNDNAMAFGKSPNLEPANKVITFNENGIGNVINPLQPAHFGIRGSGTITYPVLLQNDSANNGAGVGIRFDISNGVSYGAAIAAERQSSKGELIFFAGTQGSAEERLRIYGATGQMRHQGTEPYFIQENITHEDADGGRESRHDFRGQQSGGEDTTLARIEAGHDGTADDEKGYWDLFINGGSDGDSPTKVIRVDSSSMAFQVSEKAGITLIGGFAVKLTNQTGGNTVAGQLVKADTASDDGVILTAAGDDECFGVFLDDGVADGSEAWVVVSGIVDVAMEDNTAATHGNWVETSDAEAGYADATSATPAAAPAHFEEIGHCIESVAAGGGGTHILARCILHFN